MYLFVNTFLDIESLTIRLDGLTAQLRESREMIKPITVSSSALPEVRSDMSQSEQPGLHTMLLFIRMDIN